ncbi:MAG TPA: hypothetical protein PLD59_07595 [Tepidisphaeraceae bacterium]|nr:hypothetical protein [Tepidisphaeraceae bacterium]
MLATGFTYHPLVGDAERIDRLYRSVDDCDVGTSLARQVYFLGRPAFTSRDSQCPTSSVLTRPGGHIIFQYNRQFFDQLGADEIAFVTLHEAFHIAFRHAQRRGKRNPAIWNLACDLVINALLLEQPAFANVQTESFRRLIDGAATLAKFEPHLAYAGPVTHLSAEAIYDRIIRHPGARRAIRRLMESLRPFHVDLDPDSGTLPGATGWDSELLARRLDAMLDGHRLHRWSSHESGEHRQVQACREGNVPWDTLFANRVMSATREFSHDRWTPARRMMALYPSVILPSEQPHDEPAKINLLLAVDCSGSVDRDLLNRLVGVTRTIPRRRVEITAISFDVSAYPFDINAAKPAPRGGGGTDFRCIETHAQLLPRYPDLVAVLTDGAGEPPITQHPARWLWLLTPESTDIYIRHIGSTVQISI